MQTTTINTNHSVHEGHEAVSKSPLFSLPAELRSEIYRYAVLVDPDQHIDITSGTFPEPALLRTCRLIRHEARSIYVDENAFSICIDDYDSTELMILEEWEESLDINLTLEVKIEKSANWTNLARWLWRINGESITRTSTGYERQRGSVEHKLISALFSIAAESSEMPFDVAKKLLEPLYHVLVAMNKAWTAAHKNIWAEIDFQMREIDQLSEVDEH